MRIATIDLDAYAHNVGRIRDITGTERLIAVVKADGYGHGAVSIARAALDAGVDMLGVADIDEAIALRAAGIDAPVIAWLHGASSNFAAAIELEIRLGVSNEAQLDQVVTAAEALQRTARVHIKLDTGLNRSGARRSQLEHLFVAARQAERDGAVVIEGMFSHLANVSAESNREQGERFNSAVAHAHDAGLAPDWIHLAASEAALTDPTLRFDAVRVGIALYGLTPTDASEPASTWGLKPVMTLSSEVAMVNVVRAGEGVSYGHDWVTPADTRVALVPIGYADGLPRAASNRAEVSIGGKRYPVRGRIAMDQIVVEVGRDAIEPGVEVVVWGDPATGAPSADDWAAWAGTIGYELVTKVGRRVRYRTVGVNY